MTDSGYDKSLVDLNVKITEMAGDIKLVLLHIQNSDEKHRDHSRRLDEQDKTLDEIKSKDLPELRNKVDAAISQAVTPRKVWAALGVMSGFMAVAVAIVAIIVSA